MRPTRSVEPVQGGRKTTPFRPTVRSQADLEAVWKHLMWPHTRERGFGGHSVWMLVIDADDRPFPQITEITGAVEPPDDERVSSLAELVGGLVDRGRSFAFLRSRPGPTGVTDDDRAWGAGALPRRPAGGRVAGGHAPGL